MVETRFLSSGLDEKLQGCCNLLANSSRPMAIHYLKLEGHGKPSKSSGSELVSIPYRSINNFNT